MDCVIIDFETANSNRTSPCSLGIVSIKDGKINDEKYYLIDPEEEFDGFNIFIHGITPEMVKGKPNFKQLWPEIKQYFENTFVIAHYAAFDISILRHTLDKYLIEYPDFRYSCTKILSKNTYVSLVNYKLDTIAAYLGIKFNHHNAVEDAKATALVLNEIFNANKVDNFEDLHKLLKVKIGNVSADGYMSAHVIDNGCHSRIDIENIKPETDEFDESNELYGKYVVFTGTLTSMIRKDAMQKVINIGGMCENSVTKNTNYLIMGIQDYSKFADGQKSSKLKKAENNIKDGQNLEIITEDDFLKML